MTPDGLDDAPGVLIVADDAAAVAAATEASALAGLRLLATVSWRVACERVAELAAPAILLLETSDVSAEVVVATLPDLVDTVGASRIVIAFSADRLDQVGGLLIGSGAAMLCDATIADRVATLVMMRGTDPLAVRDSREEAARLARINAEVARFTETLAQLTGAPQGPGAALDRSTIVGDRHIDFGQPPSDTAITAAELRRAIRARRLRDEMFGSPGLFEDPAWDMLLDLFAAELERRQVSVSSLCIAAAVAPTTALRWINKLIEVGLFERRPDAFDRRRAYIALTERAVTALHNYVAAVRRAGLSIA